MDDLSKFKILSPQGMTRRNFVTAGLGTLGLASWGEYTAFAQQSKRKVIHIIGHSHIDAAWLWPWTDAADLVLTTFRSALDRMKETPGFRYSHSSAQHYRWVEKADPAMLNEIRNRIAEGRWEVVGGWPVEPDCNIPSTESFARQSLYGKRYLSKTLGVNVDIGFNPDSFGHAAGLPSILKSAGYKYYVFMRPQDHEKKLPRMFWWEGPDGSRILTYRIHKTYDSTAPSIRDAAGNVFPEGFDDGMFFFGVGDHGGAQTKAQVQQVLAMREDETLPDLRWSTVREFFAAVEASPAIKSLPVVRGDLQHHARGCYSARGEQKADNRRAEHAMFRAEAIGALSSAAYAAPYPAIDYVNAWEQILFNQFHDLLAGSALYSDYQASRDGIGLACQTALENSHSQLMAIAKQVDLRDVPEAAIFAFNPLPWRRKTFVQFHYETTEASRGNECYTHLLDQSGAKIPLQLRPSESMTNFFPRLSAWVDLPACGYKVLTLERHSAPISKPYSKNVSVSTTSFGVTSLKTDDGHDLLAGHLGLVVIEDKSDTWAHDIASFRQEIGRPAFVSAQVVEEGPVMRVTRQNLTWQNSRITAEITEFADCDALELRFVIDWNEKEQILKLEIPSKFVSPKLIAKVAGAALERSTNGEEEPYQDWIALQGEIGGQQRTLTLINAQTYSYDCLDGLLRTVLVRSAPYARHNPNKVQDNGMMAWQDQGRQERVFWLLGGNDDYTTLNLDRRAIELQTPAEYVLDSRHTGSLSREQSFLEIESGNVEVLAIKQAEDHSSTVIRLQERSGKATTVRLQGKAFKLKADVALSPWEIKTVAVTATGLLKEISIMES